jgi:hypothetical protein
MYLQGNVDLFDRPLDMFARPAGHLDLGLFEQRPGAPKLLV